MGRQKIKMEKIEADDRRHICFSKRRKGLFRKAVKLCNLGCEVAILIFSTAGHAFTFGNPSVRHVLSRFLGCNIEAPGQQGLEISEPDEEDDVLDSSEDSGGDERTSAPQTQTPMQLEGAAAAAAEDSAAMPIPLTPNAVLQNGNKIDERNEQETSEEEQRSLATEDIVKVILEKDISKKLSEYCLNTIIHQLLSGDILERILSMAQSAQEEEDKNKSLLASNTIIRSQEDKNKTNNNNTRIINTSKDQSSSEKITGDHQVLESSTEFNWRKAADDLNLDQLIKLEGLIKEHHSNVMKLADKMFEERPALSLCSWNT
ncbi:hypothetical protein J5N97_005507 [Dioscorea zingiberensis]|uniref:MADS-box domain-containing protein n=1 Tax=Dioscorea zingiberensis TaxID=325984 RepID=A0A9D5HSR2_9LILI|nr:hypothetical protein J5N97_005507 [Dioscorea zingiberensis]